MTTKGKYNPLCKIQNNIWKRIIWKKQRGIPACGRANPLKVACLPPCQRQVASGDRHDRNDNHKFDQICQDSAKHPCFSFFLLTSFK